MGLGFANAYANQILDHSFRGTAFTPPAAFYLKLHLGDPGAAGTANPAANTLRKVVTLGAAPTGGILPSTATITWTAGEVTVSETYTHWSLWDAATAGNFKMSGQLAAPRAVVPAIAVDVQSGALTVTLNVAS